VTTHQFIYFSTVISALSSTLQIPFICISSQALLFDVILASFSLASDLLPTAATRDVDFLLAVASTLNKLASYRT
jgi:hypothetical protein